MDPAKYYGMMVDEIQDMELRTAARTLSFHVGEEDAISLEAISFALYKSAGENELRKTREVLRQLIVDHGFPVCSRSGKAGRWLPGTREDAQKAAKERRNRAAKLIASAEKLERAPLPAGLPKIGEEAQPRLGI